MNAQNNGNKIKENVNGKLSLILTTKTFLYIVMCLKIKELTCTQSAAAGTHDESALVLPHRDLELPLRAHRTGKEKRGEEKWREEKWREEKRRDKKRKEVKRTEEKR
jgi:hypothetical protein